VRLLAAPDKLRGTLSAAAAAAVIAAAAGERCAWATAAIELSDGGEGFAAALGGELRRVAASGPLGEALIAPFRLLDHGSTAVIEMADVAGRALLPHPSGDEPLRASTRGVGELILAAARSGAMTIIVGCGGSATSDGGAGAIEVIEQVGGLGAVTLLVATDVTSRYLDAADAFAPQKGATPEQVVLIRQRLSEQADSLERRFGIDVRSLPRSGAAGGLAGALAAVGGRLVSGFDLVAEATDLRRCLAEVDLLVTAEGRLDDSSMAGKVVPSVIARAPDDLPVLVLAGQVDPDVANRLARDRRGPVEIISLVDEVGADRAMRDSAAVIEELVARWLTSRAPELLSP